MGAFKVQRHLTSIYETLLYVIYFLSFPNCKSHSYTCMCLFMTLPGLCFSLYLHRHRWFMQKSLLPCVCWFLTACSVNSEIWAAASLIGILHTVYRLTTIPAELIRFLNVLFTNSAPVSGRWRWGSPRAIWLAMLTGEVDRWSDEGGTHGSHYSEKSNLYQAFTAHAKLVPETPAAFNT